MQLLDLARSYWGLCAFGRSLQELPIRLGELIFGFCWRDKDCCCSATVEMGIMSHPLVQDSKHPVDVVVDGMEACCFDSIYQVVHLVFHDVLDSGEGPLLGQDNSESTHSIKGFHHSTTSLQVGLDGTVHLISETVPRERCLADNKQDTLKVHSNEQLWFCLTENMHLCRILERIPLILLHTPCCRLHKVVENWCFLLDLLPNFLYRHTKYTLLRNSQ